MKKRRGLLTSQVILVMVVISVLLSGIVMSSGTSKQTVQVDLLKSQCVFLDDALSVWYRSHSGVYPANLNVLMNMGFLSSGMDLSVFTYSTQNSNRQYRLTVVLPIGGVYVSPGSKY